MYNIFLSSRNADDMSCLFFNKNSICHFNYTHYDRISGSIPVFLLQALITISIFLFICHRSGHCSSMYWKTQKQRLCSIFSLVFTMLQRAAAAKKNEEARRSTWGGNFYNNTIAILIFLLSTLEKLCYCIALNAHSIQAVMLNIRKQARKTLPWVLARKSIHMFLILVICYLTSTSFHPVFQSLRMIYLLNDDN